jgi:hypothetical protein
MNINMEQAEEKEAKEEIVETEPKIPEELEKRLIFYEKHKEIEELGLKVFGIYSGKDELYAIIIQFKNGKYFVFMNDEELKEKLYEKYKGKDVLTRIFGTSLLSYWHFKEKIKKLILSNFQFARSEEITPE